MKFKSVLTLALLLMVSMTVYAADKNYPTQDEVQQMTRADWRKRLSRLEYQVLWEKGTERAYTGDLLKNKAQGVYVTAGCGQPVFRSEAKYNSRTGWPSFWEPINEDSIQLVEDTSFGMQRLEVISSQCGEHLGHLFTDGPDPTGKRYCINSAALDFIPD